MVNFTDKHLYLKGTCQVNVTDPCDGTVLYSSNKFQTANITTSVSLGEIRAGMGNSIATLIPSDSSLNVEFTAADFNLWAKSAQLGATVSYGAPSQTCETVTADQNGAITVSGEPVAGLGFPSPFAYVQEVGVAGSVGQTGAPYPVNGKEIVYTGQAGKRYLVNYYTRRADAQVATIGTLFNPKVVHFTAQMPVFRNDSCASNEGSRVGWLYVIVPRMKMGGNGGIVGDQSTADTTSLSGQAIAYEDENASMCGNCSSGALAYYSYVPDNEAESIQGVAIVGGYIDVPEGQTVQVPVRLVMENGQLVVPEDYEANFTYLAVNPPTGTTVSSDGKITAGTEAGDFELIIRYNNDGEILTTSAIVTVQVVSVVGIYVNGGSITVQEGTTEQIVTEIEMSDGSIITPTDFETGFTYTATGAPAGTTISSGGIITAGPNAGTFTVTVSYQSDGKTFTDTVDVTVEEEPAVVIPFSAKIGMIFFPSSTYPITLSIPYSSANLNQGTPSVDWGDGTTDNISTASGTITHTYTQAGEYDVVFRGGKIVGQVGGYYAQPLYKTMGLRGNIVYIESDQPASIGVASCLANTSNLKTFVLGPNDVNGVVGQLAFNPSALESFVSYSIKTRLSVGAFSGCRSLKSVVFHAETMTFSTNSSGVLQPFYNCSSLEVIDISKLTSVPAMPTADWADGIPTTAQIKVPAALLNDFKTATNWSIRANQFVGV